MSTTEHFDHAEAERVARPGTTDSPLVAELRHRLRGQLKKTADYDALRVEHDRLVFNGLLTHAELSHLNVVQVETLTEWAGQQTEVTSDRLRDRSVALGFVEPDPFNDDV